MVQNFWSSVSTGWERALAAAGTAPFELTLAGIGLGACLLLVACALGLRRVAAELAEGRAELVQAALSLRGIGDPIAGVGAELARIRERVEKTVPPEIHVDAIVAQQLEIRAGAGVNGGRRSNPNFIVQEFD